MANLTFPSNPTNGQKVTVNDKVFVYNSTTSRWTATRLQVLGNLTGDFTIAPPELSLSNNTVAFDTTGQTVYITYTVDQDVKATIANNGIANSSYANVTLHQTNNTIQITAGTQEFSSANVVLTVTNTRTSNTASINLSAAYGGSFEISNLVAYAWDNSLTGGQLDTNQTTTGGGFVLEAQNYVRAVTVSDDGLKMWFANGANGRIHQITLSQKILSRYGNYVTSLDKVQLHPTNGFRDGVQQIEFNGDGTKVFVLREGQYASLYEYSLSTAYDISTAVNANGINRLTAVNDALVAEFGVAYSSSYIAFTTSFRFINSGNGFTLVNLTHPLEAIHQFTLSTPYDLSSTITYQKGWYTDTSTAGSSGWATDPNIDHIPGFSGNEIYPYDFMYNKSGTKALALIADSTTSGGGFAEWTFSTPFDLTTATNDVYPANAVGVYAWCFATNSLADTLYIGLDGNEYIRQYAWS